MKKNASQVEHTRLLEQEAFKHHSAQFLEVNHEDVQTYPGYREIKAKSVKAVEYKNISSIRCVTLGQEVTLANFTGNPIAYETHMQGARVLNASLNPGDSDFGDDLVVIVSSQFEGASGLDYIDSLRDRGCFSEEVIEEIRRVLVLNQPGSHGRNAGRGMAPSYRPLYLIYRFDRAQLLEGGSFFSTELDMVFTMWTGSQGCLAPHPRTKKGRAFSALKAAALNESDEGSAILSLHYVDNDQPGRNHWVNIEGKVVKITSKASDVPSGLYLGFGRVSDIKASSAQGTDARRFTRLDIPVYHSQDAATERGDYNQWVERKLRQEEMAATEAARAHEMELARTRRETEEFKKQAALSQIEADKDKREHEKVKMGFENKAQDKKSFIETIKSIPAVNDFIKFVCAGVMAIVGLFKVKSALTT